MVFTGGYSGDKRRAMWATEESRRKIEEGNDCVEEQDKGRDPNEKEREVVVVAGADAKFTEKAHTDDDDEQLNEIVNHDEDLLEDVNKKIHNNFQTCNYSIHRGCTL